MNLSDLKFSLDFSNESGLDLQVLPNILSPAGWLDAVVMVGVMSVKAQLAQGFSTHACRQDWPPGPCAEHPCWQRQNPDVNLLLKCQSVWCEIRCDVFWFFFFNDRFVINWQPSAAVFPTQRIMGPNPRVVGSHRFQLDLKPAQQQADVVPELRFRDFSEILWLRPDKNTAEIRQPHHFLWSTGKY